MHLFIFLAVMLLPGEVNGRADFHWDLLLHLLTALVRHLPEHGLSLVKLGSRPNSPNWAADITGQTYLLTSLFRR